MELVLLGVRDRTAEFFFPPFFARTKVEGLRSFTQLINDKARTGAPSEYELVHLAIFDDQTGHLEVLPVPSLMANGSDVVPKE